MKKDFNDQVDETIELMKEKCYERYVTKKVIATGCFKITPEKLEKLCEATDKVYPGNEIGRTIKNVLINRAININKYCLKKCRLNQDAKEKITKNIKNIKNIIDNQRLDLHGLNQDANMGTHMSYLGKVLSVFSCFCYDNSKDDRTNEVRMR